MSDSESDEDLKRAIALSLQEQPPFARPQDSILIDLVSDDDDDDDDDDLDAPVTAKPATRESQPLSADAPANPGSNHTASQTPATPSKSVVLKTPNEPARAKDVAPSVGLAGLDRRSMEEARLKRVQMQQKGAALSVDQSIPRKRQASISSPRLREQERPHTKAKLSDTAAPTRNLHSVLSLNIEGVQYPDGIVKKTWVNGMPRHGDDIKIEEVLQKNDLELAVLSAFQIEPEWVESKLNQRTKVIWVLQAKTDAERQNISSKAPANYRFCFPNMEGNINCMHSKLQLLAHPTHLRVVVPSANLTSYDWGETGIMENICFLIDLPRLPPGEKTVVTNFANELVYFVEQMGLDQKTATSLQNFDFSRTAHLAFVHSIGGSHSGSTWKRTGYCGLGTAIKKLGMATEVDLNIEFLSASIGSLNDSFMECLYLAAQGDDGATEYRWRTEKPTKSKGRSAAEHKLLGNVNSNCRIYFPTKETVEASRGGVTGGGTICLQSKWFDSDTFPRKLMRDCKSVRKGILMHNKMIFARARDQKQYPKIAWAYVGSHNLSESAWYVTRPSVQLGLAVILTITTWLATPSWGFSHMS
ncbi:uncharacterized protein L3040_008629 [Drepanopeziza brunnea f. sp. 'multigermtubi']|uniref:uncharacterized protein n=1 Tax=Drepanopeziza brunnea f. sp. 'multigermtubi' TaxID=698441 RepID=UPI00239432F8|nr:hypothetical protein L3040_008629 [Drepanopeziza brunnea f. sp. 'multigermtubi']